MVTVHWAFCLSSPLAKQVYPTSISQSHSGGPAFKETENERSQVFKHLEWFRKKTCATRPTSFPHFPQSIKQTVSLQLLKISKKTSRGELLHLGKLLKKKENRGRGGRKGEKKTNETRAQEHRATLTATVLTTSQKVLKLFLKQKSPTLIHWCFPHHYNLCIRVNSTRISYICMILLLVNMTTKIKQISTEAELRHFVYTCPWKLQNGNKDYNTWTRWEFTNDVWLVFSISFNLKK